MSLSDTSEETSDEQINNVEEVHSYILEDLIC